MNERLDPNQVLAGLRQAFKNSEDTHFKEDAFDSLVSARFIFRKLDEWLSKGAQLPDAWLYELPDAPQRLERTP